MRRSRGLVRSGTAGPWVGFVLVHRGYLMNKPKLTPVQSSSRIAHMKTIILSFLFFQIAQAQIPYSELENLRQKLVAVRVVMDDPASKPAKKCKLGDEAAGLGGKLELAFADKEAGWAKLQISSKEITQLKSKTKSCHQKGSCYVYEKFLNKVQSPESLKPQVDQLISILVEKQKTMNAKSYLRALSSVPNYCKILKSM